MTKADKHSVIRQLKKITLHIFAGANTATVVLMLLVGYSDRLYPVDHPILSTAGMVLPFFLLANLVFLLFWLTFKWRYAWIPLAGYALAYVPISIYMPIHPRQTVPEDAFKIISYNVCCYGGNYKYENGFDTILQYLQDEKADIVCVQEDADGKKRQRVVEKYAKAFPHNDTLVIMESPKALSAIGIHTRYPIIRRERIEYPSFANGSAAWWLQIGSDTVIVINNHFESCHLNKNDRQQYRNILHGELTRDSIRSESQVLLVKLAEANAKRAVEIDAVRRYADEHSQYPVIVCGDFNDNPISYSRHAMSQTLTDCFVSTGTGIGLSYNQKAFSFRIDHIFCSEKITPYNCKVDNKFDASDHYPIQCWLKIGRNEGKKHEKRQ